MNRDNGVRDRARDLLDSVEAVRIAWLECGTAARPAGMALSTCRIAPNCLPAGPTDCRGL